MTYLTLKTAFHKKTRVTQHRFIVRFVSLRQIWVIAAAALIFVLNNRAEKHPVYYLAAPWFYTHAGREESG